MTRQRTRWGPENDKLSVPGLPTALPPNLTKEQMDSYVIHVRVEEIGRKLRLGNIVLPEKQGSVSPEPVYGSDGSRLNSREQRYREALDAEKLQLVDWGLRNIPGFRPPIDYKKAIKLQEKVYLPVRDFPDINFIGLLIGPRGHTLKKMEADAGVKISIRGRGSVKEGKQRADGLMNPGEDEDLHALVMAEDDRSLRAGVRMIDHIIETATSTPEGQLELKRSQLRELAALNGTLREDEAQICTNCGSLGHRRWECPEASNFTTSLVCRICNGIGHVARDCIQKNNPDILDNLPSEETLEAEYATLMAELGARVQTESAAVSADAPWSKATEAPAPPSSSGKPWDTASAPQPPPVPASSAPWHQPAPPDSAPPPPPE